MLGLLALVGILLAGCSSVSTGSVQSLRLAFGHDTIEPTAASVAALPYYQLQVDGRSGRTVLVLAKVEGDRLGWYGAQHDIVFTRDGLLVKTVGLAQNLDDQALGEGAPFHAGLQHLRGPLDYVRRMDWSPGYRYGVQVRAHLEPKGLESVTILGTSRQLLRVDERLTVLATGQAMDNRYWVDPADGFIWRSRQHVTPDFALELTQLRPYRESHS